MSKFMITLLIFISIIGLINITGCSKINDIKSTAIDNIIKEDQLPQFTLDRTNYEEISYEDKVYIITDEEVDNDKVQDAIGKISYVCTLDENKIELSKDELRKIDVYGIEEENERYYLKFGWVHEIKGISSGKEVAININNLYYRCKIKTT